MNTLGTEAVSTIMTTQLFSVGPSDFIRDAKNIITQNAVRHVIVLENEKIVGILSRIDLEKYLHFKKKDANDTDSKLAETMTVQQIMTQNVHCIQIDDTIKDTAELLSLSSYHALPVLDGEKLAGIVTSTDLILYLLKHCN